jgi:SAM-dependent methyltransferase
VTEPDFLRETRASYDAIAAGYAERFAEVEAAKPLDRAVLDAFAEYVRGAGDLPVADVGCGPGRVTAYLNSRGLTAFGVDLSPGMIEVARASHPGLRFEVGSMLALDLPDDSLGGVLAWYSTIHVPDELLPQALAEFRRVLVPGGHLLLAFQAGDEPLHRTEAMGHSISLVFRRRRRRHGGGRDLPGGRFRVHAADDPLVVERPVEHDPQAPGRVREHGGEDVQAAAVHRPDLLRRGQVQHQFAAVYQQFCHPHVLPAGRGVKPATTPARGPSPRAPRRRPGGRSRCPGRPGRSG